MPFLAKKHVDIPTKDILSWSFDDPKYDQDKPIYIDAIEPANSISCRQAKPILRKLIAGLRQAGLRRGDCVCIHSFNHLYYPILVLAIIGAGGAFTGTNPAYTPIELKHHLNMTRAKLVIVEPELLERVTLAMDKHNISKSNIFIFGDDERASTTGYRSWKTLFNTGEEDWIRFDDMDTARSTTAMLLSTSGTTGLPKGAMISHYNLVAQHTLVFEINPTGYDVRRLIALPMFHAAMAPAAHTTPFRTGHVTYILRKFDVEQYMSAVARHKITDLVIVPPVVLAVIMSPLREKYSMKSVRYALAGAAPLDPGPQKRFKELIGDGAPFTQVWGMTESSCIFTMTHYPGHDDSGSVGHLLPNCDIKFVDDDGQEVTTPNPRGEMCIRGPGIVRGYYQSPEANKESFDADGFYHTGDVGYFDEESGKIYIVDRKKELIKVRAFQVAPNEIEGVLLSHPSIIDAAVIGVKHPESPDTELPRAYVVLRAGERMTEAEVVEFAAGQLARYKRLEGGVKFVDAIPKTASGKILKRLLREEAAKEIMAKL